VRRNTPGVRGNVKKIFRTDLGWAGIAASDSGVAMVVLPRKDKKSVGRELNSREPGVRSSEGGAERIVNRAVVLLQKYFSGGPVAFDLPIDTRYYTAFQQSVWKAASAIPFGETRSYAWIAGRIRNPHAARAVGQALGANPIPVIIPCHRVIGSSGSLRGFSAGIGMKKELLKRERGHGRR